jgi:hypothetical protein
MAGACLLPTKPFYPPVSTDLAADETAAFFVLLRHRSGLAMAAWPRPMRSRGRRLGSGCYTETCSTPCVVRVRPRRAKRMNIPHFAASATSPGRVGVGANAELASVRAYSHTRFVQASRRPPRPGFFASVPGLGNCESRTGAKGQLFRWSSRGPPLASRPQPAISMSEASFLEASLIPVGRQPTKLPTTLDLAKGCKPIPAQACTLARP